MMTLKRRRSSSGFTLIELLVTLAIVGILVAIAIWNYYVGISKARQRRTMADMRAVAVAWESRAIETRAYNAAAVSFWPTVPVTKEQLDAMLVPTYIRTLPQRDGWNRYLDYALDSPVGDAVPANTYGIRSAGRDGIFDPNYIAGGTTNFDCDIVYMNGVFVCYPEATQQQ